MCKIFEEIREKGRNEGYTDGIEEEKKNFVRTMLMNEEPIEKIEKYTGLSIDRIISIKNNMIYA